MMSLRHCLQRFLTIHVMTSLSFRVVCFNCGGGGGGGGGAALLVGGGAGSPTCTDSLPLSSVSALYSE